jgi:hypothetical protein
MILPLVTSLAVAGVSTPAVLLGLAVVAGFLAHEPLLVLLGRRGARAKREHWLTAAVWFGISAATALGAGGVAFWAVSSALRWSFILPLVPAAFLTGAIAAEREKSLLGELVVALAFSLIAVPVCLAAGATTTTALAIGTTFALVFVLGTLVVRATILDGRRGGNARAARLIRTVVLTLSSTAGLGLALTSRGLLGWTTLLAAAPGLVAASWMAVFPPPPTRLRTVGWTLVATFTATALILIGGLLGRVKVGP